MIARKVRSELRRKAAKFAEAGARAVRADTPQDVERFLDAFLVQKSKRLACAGARRSFRRARNQGVLPRCGAARSRRSREAWRCTRWKRERPSAGGARRRAPSGPICLDGAILRHRPTPWPKYSPSEALIAEVLAESCRRGFTDVRFRRRLEPVQARFGLTASSSLFNLTHAVGPKGRLYAGLVQLAGAAARYIKRNPEAVLGGAGSACLERALSRPQRIGRFGGFLCLSSVRLRSKPRAAPAEQRAEIVDRRDALFRETAWQKCQRVALGTAWSLLPTTHRQALAAHARFGSPISWRPAKDLPDPDDSRPMEAILRGWSTTFRRRR